ncbi:bifunctional DNA primase/polymerase [Streptomyces ovatisporus]|uniref:Bifunctional DNA primase/polymerase n=1 Tax=Streptomyces ovatisporus TaxID=1128682 RepID=A0ABV9AHK9_9ACTN
MSPTQATANTALGQALKLASVGVPALPLREGKVPFGNCSNCATPKGSRTPICGGRPNMKDAGSCACPLPCHGWAAATIDADTLNSAAWRASWREAVAAAYHPGAAGLTVVDLDNADAVTWARESLPPTRIVQTTRGEHWLYLGAMQSSNGVRPGVDIKSRRAYARWLGPGEGRMTVLPDAVRALTVREEATLRGALASRPTWNRSVASGCRHTESYIERGLEMAREYIKSHRESGAATAAYARAGAIGAAHRQCPGPCQLEALGWELVSAAMDVGVPEAYAARAVENGFAGAGAQFTPTNP